ncbi:Fic family protein [Brachybacterium sp. Marseille-Q2903]|uniref:Fic family protein n=1 Tax=Brachybacterium epidermidis TaxID=2781983 RepID=A0ABR9W3D3_9MICO|nr:Fic family protein [Brachybacterium epidermidis]MBE9404957.1 Fic family protein [Brachybacterium epidermidis]
MNAWEEQEWQSSAMSGLPRRDRRSGPFLAYVPDTLVQAPLVLGREAEHLLATAESKVRSLTGLSDDLPAISRFLLRSEAIASSRIEGIAPSARQVALAELGQSETVQGVSAPAQMVANNMTLVREATTRLVGAPLVTVESIIDLHRSLLRDEPHHHGIRDVQNWIGGSDWHPLDADFVPPPAVRVEPAMQDLVDYMNGASHAPIVQAALVHAQFETIHPFTDGNGRVGRALIHSVLTRRGLTPDSVLPVSLVLSTLRDRYVDHLQQFRDVEGRGSGSSGRERWISFFAEVTLLASEQAVTLSGELSEIREEWEQRLTSSRQRRGSQRALRSDSATALILADMVGTPVLTVDTAQRIHGVSRVAALRALDELHEAEILTRRSIGSGRHAYVSGEVLDLITWAERRLASTKFDTRKSPPHPGVPAPPQRPPL